MSETKDKIIEKMTIIQNDAMKLFKKKSDEYNNSIAIDGNFDVILSTIDRIKVLTCDSSNAITPINNELLIESLLDLCNYSGMAIMSINKKTINNDINTNVNSLNEISKKTIENFYEYISYY